MIGKKLWLVFPILLVILTIIFFELKSEAERKSLSRNSLSNKVVKVRHNWTGGRSLDYVTDNNQVITLLNSDTLFVGDSISKKAGARKFDVYRKKNGNYEFHRTFAIGK